MSLQPIASLLARLWQGLRAPPGPDAADLGTAFGLDMSLRDADAGQATRALGSAVTDAQRAEAMTKRSHRDH